MADRMRGKKGSQGRMCDGDGTLPHRLPSHSPNVRACYIDYCTDIHFHPPAALAHRSLCYQDGIGRKLVKHLGAECEYVHMQLRVLGEERRVFQIFVGHLLNRKLFGVVDLGQVHERKRPVQENVIHHLAGSSFRFSHLRCTCAAPAHLHSRRTRPVLHGGRQGHRHSKRCRECARRHPSRRSLAERGAMRVTCTHKRFSDRAISRGRRRGDALSWAYTGAAWSRGAHRADLTQTRVPT